MWVGQDNVRTNGGQDVWAGKSERAPATAPLLAMRVPASAVGNFPAAVSNSGETGPLFDLPVGPRRHSSGASKSR